MMPTVSELAQNVMNLIPMLLSLTVHEWAHAYSAWKLGDDTAMREGRLTLNPLVHIDPVGTLLLPLMGVPFGWAKPVPVNPARFHRGVTMGTGMAITAFAGPLSNLILSVLCAVGLGLLIRFTPGQHYQENPIAKLLEFGIMLNVSLALFNMLPLPPLDGSRIVERFIPYKQRDAWDNVKRIGPFLLMVVMVSGVRFLDGPIYKVSNALFELVRRIAQA